LKTLTDIVLSGGHSPNDSIFVTVTVSGGWSATTTTATVTQVGPTVTATVTQTPAAIVPPSPPSPSPAVSPIIPRGFNAKSFDNGDVQLFYEDYHGNIQSLQYENSQWSSSDTIASNVKPGTTITLSIIGTDVSSWGSNSDDPVQVCESILHDFRLNNGCILTNKKWRVLYIDADNVLQERTMTTYWDPDYGDPQGSLSIGLTSQTSWTSGNLGSLKYKVADDSLFLRACTWPKDPEYAPSEAPDSYLYFMNNKSQLTKLAWFASSDTWKIVSDAFSPDPGSIRSVDCSGSDSGLEILWLVNGSYIKQYWAYVNTSDPAYGSSNLSMQYWNEGKQLSLP
jgi:hypothetical protein